MKNYLYTLILVIAAGLSFNAFAEPLTGKTITFTNTTGKALIIKAGVKEYTITPNQSKTFNFESLKGASVGFVGSLAPYRPLDLAGIALGLQRNEGKMNVNVDMVPGSIWAAKGANISYGPAPKNAVKA